MNAKKIQFLVLLLLLPFSLRTGGQNLSSLPRSTPEAQGVSSDGILKFLESVESSNHEFHSFMFLRHGKIIAEGWWDPYRPDLKHTMYSLSKSFTSTAVGFAVTEKLLKLEDKVITFFPKDLPDTVSRNLKDLRVKDLLTMTAGQEPDPTASIRNWDANWIKSFLSVPIVNKPGTKFLYNSVATFMLSAIVQKVTGMKIIDYLKPRLFDPLGIKGMDWEVSPTNINTGGWGLRLKTEDMAKFGQFYLQKGKWNGKQLLPEKWIEEATTIKVEQDPNASQSKKDSSDWLQGYCYKFWRCRHNCFRGDGAFGQYIIVMPDQDAVIAITSETANMQGELDLVWKYLLPSIRGNKLPADKRSEAALKQKLSSLALLPVAKGTDSPWPARISGRTFLLDPNQNEIKSLTFQINEKRCDLTIKTDSSSYKMAFGSGKWLKGETSRFGPNLIANKKNSYIPGFPLFKIAGSYCWKDGNTLELILRYIESPHSEKFICRFNGKNIEVEKENSFEQKGKKLILKGNLE
jgi:CubicO group peptidase (beta-lactamase class C family)